MLVPGKPEASRLYLVLEMKPGQPKAMPPGKQLPKPQRDIDSPVDCGGRDLAGGIVLRSRSLPARRTRRQPSSSCTPASRSRAQEKSQADMKPYKTTIPNTEVTFEMIPIKGGEFMMGTPASETGHKQG